MEPITKDGRGQRGSCEWMICRCYKVMFVSDRDPVCPGDRIGRDGTDCLSGSGTHVWQGSVVASVVGELRCERPAAGRLPVASVRIGSRSEGPAADVVSAIAIGDEVLCRVRRLNPRYATCDVLCRGTKPLLKNFSGLIRVQDVRATEIDKVSIISSFRPGDLVRAEVISLGEAQSLLLSTAKDSLGVLEARSEQGEAMVAVNDEEMACPVTKTREGRKCTKVQ